MTQDVISGRTVAERQSISDSRSGSFARTVCERKLVSTSTPYGGLSAVLYWKNMCAGAGAL